MGKALMCGQHGATLVSAEEFQLGGIFNGGTEANHRYSVTEDASFTGFRGEIASGGSGTNTFQFRDTGANGQQVASRAGTGAFEDTTHTDTLTAGDDYCIAYTDTGTDSVVRSIAMNVEFASGHGCFHGASGATQLVFDVASATRYLPIDGILAADGSSTLTGAQTKIREYTSIEAFQVRINANARLNNSVFSVNVNGTDVGTAITYATTVTGLQVVTGMGISLSPGDLVCISLTLGTGVEDLTLGFVGMTLKSTTNGSMACCNSAAGITRAASATPNYFSFGHGSATTETSCAVRVGFSARCKNLRLYAGANTYTADATLKLFVNGSAVLTTTITASTIGWFENTTDTFDIGPTDVVSFEIVGGTSGSITVVNITIGFGESEQPPRSMHRFRMQRAA